MSESKTSVIQRLGDRYGVDSKKLYETLKNTAFKGGATNEQMMALMIVADQYKLNPFTKEIYAFPDRNNGIVPVVGVDGWSRIINEHPQFDGMDFQQDGESCTCTIHRKDRNHPVSATEYMEECNRKTGPWQSHPRRMLRHKAMIQAARLAFGYTGIKDPDEAERIVEATGAAEPIKETRAADDIEISEPVYQQPAEKPVESIADDLDYGEDFPLDAGYTSEPKPQADTVRGQVQNIEEKSGESKKGKWTRYGIQVNGTWYSTFNARDAETARYAYDNEADVVIGFEQDGRYMNAKTIDIVPEKQ